MCQATNISQNNTLNRLQSRLQPGTFFGEFIFLDLADMMRNSFQPLEQPYGSKQIFKA